MRVRRATMLTVLAAIAPATASSQKGGQGAGVARFGVSMPMRDGVNLVANIWLPDTTAKHPTILIRTPYDKTPQFKRYKLAAYVKRGYAVVLQDTRGRGDSGGEFDFYFPEGTDGYDTIEWIAKQPWSNGRVAMDGGSYLGTVQWLAARERPPHLVCIAPYVSSGRLFDEIPYLGGAFRLDWALSWLNQISGRVSQSDLNELVSWDSLLRKRPLTSLDARMGRSMPIYQAMLAHSTLDDYWKRISFTADDFKKISIPTLTVTGWFDGDQAGALSYWDGIEANGPNKEQSYLIIGPWNHGQTYLGGARKIGEIELAQQSILDSQAIRLAFFDWCLARKTPAFDSPRVRTYLTGSDRWVMLDRYPAPNQEIRSLFLHSGGRANTLNGDGRLSWTPPDEEPNDRFSYDPANPVPAKGATSDHRSIEAREDVLVYTSEALTDSLDVLGRVFVQLHASSDATDTDFTAKLLDVYPDGRAVALGPIAVGVRRARYRNGYDRTELLVPNKPERFSIELFDIGHSLLPGHRIRVEISSSAAPFISPNPNTGNPIATDTTWKVANQTIYHDRNRASAVLLPVLTR